MGQAVARLSAASSLDEVGNLLRETARRLIGSDGIALVLRDGDDCHYVEEDAVSPLWKGGRFPMSSCISGWTMIHRQTAVIPDILQDARIPQELYRRTFVRALVMAPIGSGTPVGALGAYWAQTYQPSPEEVDTVVALAAAAATALERLAGGAAAMDARGGAEAPATTSAGRRRAVLGQRGPSLTPREPLPFWRGQLFALSSVLLTFLVRSALTPLLGASALYTSFLPAVLLTGLWGGPRAAATGVVVGVAGAAVLDLRLNPQTALGPRLATWAFFALVAGVAAAVAASVRTTLEAERRRTAALEERDAELATLSRELDHRIRNTLTVVTALVMQSARTSATPAEMSEKLAARIDALGRAQTIVVRGGGWGSTLRDLVETALAPFAGEGQIVVDVPETLVAPAGGEVSLVLALHELATNAVKHGAWARRAGSLTVRARHIRGEIQLRWEEMVLSDVGRPTSRGAGSRLIERAVGSVPGGKVDVRFERTGLVCEISWPAQGDVEPGRGSARRSAVSAEVQMPARR